MITVFRGVWGGNSESYFVTLSYVELNISMGEELILMKLLTDQGTYSVTVKLAELVW